MLGLSGVDNALAIFPHSQHSAPVAPSEETNQGSESETEHPTGTFDSKNGLNITETLLVGGLVRRSIVHLPSDYKPGKKFPLVFVLHGARLSGWIAQLVTGFDKIANEEGFIVAYPDAIHQQWNDGRGEGDTPSYGINDVEYISMFMDYLVLKYNADPEKIYVAGYSSGGMLAQKLGLELTDKVAAIAEVASSFPLPQLNLNRQPSRPISILMINGTQDRAFPWEGGTTRIVRVKVGVVVPIMTTFNYWVQVNGGPGALPDRQEALQKNKYGPTVDLLNTRTNNGSCVMLYKINGGGHTWPGSEVPLRYIPLLGRQSKNLNASELIWEFFKRNQKDCQPI